MYYYLDTSIWLDHYEKRGKNGVSAKRFLLKIVEKEAIIFYSDLIIKELKRLEYGPEEIKTILSAAKTDKIKRVYITKLKIKEATKLAKKTKVPRGDALHAILARDNGAIMISRDRHFESLRSIVISKKPEEV